MSQYRRIASEGARVVLFTANAHASDIAQSLGCDGYITKPFDIDSLVGIIARELPDR